MTERHGDWMQVYSGGRYYPLDPHVDEVLTEDIAEALSKQCRFNGHIRGFLSVAEHSVNVSLLVPRWCALEGLFHDGSETYTGDMIRPLKHQPEMSVFREVEDLNERIVAARYNLIHPWPPQIKEADNQVVRAEIDQLRKPIANGHYLSGSSVSAPIKVIGMEWREARDYWIRRFNELMATREQDILLRPSQYAVAA